MPAKPKIKKAVPQTPDEKEALFKDAEMPEVGESKPVITQSANVAGRGKKTCPSCGSIIGARTTNCACGFEFVPKSPKSPKLEKDEQKSDKGSNEHKLLNLLGSKGVPVEIVSAWNEGQITTTVKIGGKASKFQWLVEDKPILEKSEILLNTSGNQARVEMPLDAFLSLI